MHRDRRIRYYRKGYRLSVGLIIMLCFAQSSVMAQNGLFLFGSLEFGVIGKNYTFEEKGTVLKRKWLGTEKDDSDLLFNPEIGLCYHFNDHLGVSVNVKLTNMSAVFHDQRFMDANNINGVDFEPNMGKLRADSGNFNPNRNYVTPNVSVKYLFNTERSAAGPYLAYGFGMNHLLAPRAANLSYFHHETDEVLELSLDYRSWYPSQYLELGYLFFPDSRGKPSEGITTRGSMFDLSFRYTFAGTYFHGNYRVTQNGTLLYTDAVSMRGNYFSVVVKIGGSIFGQRIDDRLRRKIE